MNNMGRVGYAIGSPAFGTMHVDEGGNVTFSRLDANPSDGYNVSVNPSSSYSEVTPMDECVSVEQNNTCGTFQSVCRVLVDPALEIEGSIRETISYRGPPAGYVDARLLLLFHFCQFLTRNFWSPSGLLVTNATTEQRHHATLRGGSTTEQPRCTRVLRALAGRRS